MRKLLLIVLFLWAGILQAKADEASLLTRIYTSVSQDYVEPTEVGNFAIVTLKSLQKLDKRLQVADFRSKQNRKRHCHIEK